MLYYNSSQVYVEGHMTLKLTLRNIKYKFRLSGMCFSQFIEGEGPNEENVILIHSSSLHLLKF